MTFLANALALLQDTGTTTTTTTTNPQISNAMAGMGVGLVLFIVLLAFAVLAFLIYLLWRVFTKAGLSGALSFLVIVPFGPLIVLCILAFSDWKVVPIAQAQATVFPPSYTPPSFPSTPGA
jgi:hypothetical protein